MDANLNNKINLLVDEVILLAGKPPLDIERHSWSIVHEFRHGFKPTEYDIRDIDETLYIEVLDRVKAKLVNN